MNNQDELLNEMVRSAKKHHQCIMCHQVMEYRTDISIELIRDDRKVKFLNVTGETCSCGEKRYSEAISAAVLNVANALDEILKEEGEKLAVFDFKVVGEAMSRPTKEIFEISAILPDSRYEVTRLQDNVWGLQKLKF